MDNQEILVSFEKLSKQLEQHRNTLSNVVNLLVNLSNVVNDGFAEANSRLATLEGKHGMQGVNAQLNDIKSELHKIQKTYPYDDLFNNMKTSTSRHWLFFLLMLLLF